MEDQGASMVMGTSDANENWQERGKVLCDPEHWAVMVGCGQAISDGLTESEKKRLEPKVDMVIEATRIMLAGMVKGTIKYPNDDYTIDRWMSHLVGEGMDQANYQILLATAWKKLRASEPLAPSCPPAQSEKS